MTDGEPTVVGRSTPFCSACGRALEAGARYCGVCGAERLDSTDPDATRPIVTESTTVMERVEDDPVVVDDPVLVAARDSNLAWWLAAVAAAVVILFLLVALLTRDDDDDDETVATSPTTVVVVPEDTTAPPVAVAPPVADATPAPPMTSQSPTAGDVGSGGSTATTASAPVARQGKAQPFELTDLEVLDEGGRFAGRASIRNSDERARGGSFTVRLFKGGRAIGTLTGNVSSIPAGSTQTVSLTSSDAYVDGVDRYEFAAQPS